MPVSAAARVAVWVFWTAGATWAAAILAAESAAPSAATDGWVASAPREEIAPDFAVQQGAESVELVIRADDREGLDGFWQKSFAVQGGHWCHFQARRRVEGVEAPRRSACVRIVWADDQGRPVAWHGPVTTRYRPDTIPTAVPEHPRDRDTDADGWTLVSDAYHVPPKATQAIVELHLRWAPGGEVRWRDVSLLPCQPPAGRPVRLAAVHYRPQGGKSPMDNCRQFAPLVEEAARQQADLVVLPETLTIYRNGYQDRPADAAEAVPGPTTEYFGTLASQHKLYLVVGLYERAGHLVYNVAVLIGPDGQIVGKYRKVTLPREEIARGIAPGNDYPVFDTRFGKVGMMVCYDAFYPEVARHLANRGAEVIALPVWGCNPLLAAARAAENHVYLVSSTYTDAADDWIRTAVFDHTGKMLTAAQRWGTVVVAEVDLDERTYWPGMGDFGARIQRERPLWGSEPAAGPP